MYDFGNSHFIAADLLSHPGRHRSPLHQQRERKGSQVGHFNHCPRRIHFLITPLLCLRFQDSGHAIRGGLVVDSELWDQLQIGH